MIYIGQSNNNRRWSQHKYFAKHPEKTGQYIHRAMNKYGIDNFEFEVIAQSLTQEDANWTEDILIIQYDSRNKESGYNLTMGGSHGGHSEETKRKIGNAQLGEKNHMFGKNHTEESLQKMEDARTNGGLLKMSEAAKLRVGEKNHFYGRKHYPETLKKMSESHKQISPETRLKMSLAKKGKKLWHLI